MKSIETIPDYLARMRVKDQTKHGMELGGLRTTQEIAEYFYMSPMKMRKILWNLAKRNLIEAFGRCEWSPGRPLVWSAIIVEDDPDPDGGEPLPANDNEIDGVVSITCP